MFADATEALEFVASEDIEMIDLRTIDLTGRRRHVTLPAGHLTAESLRLGTRNDTSSNVG